MNKDGQIVKAKRKSSSYQLLINLIFPLISVFVGLIIGAIFMLIIKTDPFKAYQVLWNSSFGSLRGFAETIVNTTPLIFTGLAVAFAFRTGLFNIGGEGQILLGYAASAWIGYALQLPVYLHVPLALLAAIIASGIWGGFAGYLKATLGVHEVITTIMLNYIALHFVGYLVGGPLKDPNVPLPATPKIFETARLYRLMPPGRVNISIFIALVVAIFIYYFLWKTSVGYEVRAVGLNPDASEYGGINVAKNMILAMFISGALAGLAGATQTLGLEFRAYQPFNFIGYGFTGIAVALLGKNHPAGVVLAAFLFGVLARGAMLMQSIAGVPKEVVEIIQAIIILFVASEYLISFLVKKARKRKGVVQNVH